MTKNLYDVLLKKQQRETSGSDTSSRFSYQHAYALLELMRRHSLPGSYAVAFEFHDDVVFFNDEVNPTVAEFAQVKTHGGKGPKRLSTLYSCPKGKSSILAKLISNLDKVPKSFEVALWVVCNKEFDFSNKTISYSDLDIKYRKKIETKLSAEIENFDSTVLDQMEFHVVDVAIDKIETHIKGAAVEFLEFFEDDQQVAAPMLWLRIMQSEVRRRNDRSSCDIKNPEDLLTKKCFRKSEVDEIIKKCVSRKILPEYISNAGKRAEDAGWSIRKSIRFQEAVTRAHTNKLNPTDTSTRDLCEAIRPDLLDLPDLGFTDTVLQAAEIVRKHNKDQRYRNEVMEEALGYLQFYEAVSSAASDTSHEGAGT